MINCNSMEFTVYLSFKCNFNCDMCFQNSDFKKSNIKELSVEEWDIFFDSIIKKIKHPKIVFMGGEPLLHKDFDEILLNAYKKGIYCTIITNGYFLDKHFEMIKKTDTGIILSIHGLEDTHNKIVKNKNSFQKTKNILEKITEIKKTKKYKDFFCQTNTVILPDNIDELPDLILFLKQYKLNGIRFEHPNFLNSATELASHQICKKMKCASDIPLQFDLCKKYNFSEKEYHKKINNFFSQIKKYKNIIQFPDFWKEETELYYDNDKIKDLRKGRICSVPWRVPLILPNGDVQNCLYSTIGNFLEQDFWKIWNGNNAKKLRTHLKTNKELPSCKRCCSYYEDFLIYAKNNLIELQDERKLYIAKQLTLIEACRDGYLIMDTKDPKKSVKIMPYNTLKEKKQIENCEKITAKISDIKNDTKRGKDA